MREKIANEIILHQTIINELKNIKESVSENIDNTVKFMVETKRYIGCLDMSPLKRRDKLDISIRTMNMILDESIKKEKEKIDKLIDEEIHKKFGEYLKGKIT